MENPAINQLQELGFNKLEAEVYHLLLTQEPLTAYRIGKLLKKPTANIYKAVESLSQMGAVIIQNGSSKKCIAVHYTEYIELMKTRFNRKVENLATELATLKKKVNKDGLYTIESADLLFEKAKSMIESSEKIISIDIFPGALERLRKTIEKAIKRGVIVNIIAYEETQLEKANLIVSPVDFDVYKYWKSEQLNLAVDGKESLVALLSLELDEVYHATLSNNIYLSCVLQGFLLREYTMNQIMSVPDSKDKLNQIQTILDSQEFFHDRDIPGFNLLFDIYQ